jgi:hypothetical protein
MLNGGVAKVVGLEVGDPVVEEPFLPSALANWPRKYS